MVDNRHNVSQLHVGVNVAAKSTTTTIIIIIVVIIIIINDRNKQCQRGRH